jgi:sarcosine oxidase subunit gamma
MTAVVLRAGPAAAHTHGLAEIGGTDTVSIRALPLSGYVSLRLDPRNRTAVAAVGRVIGTAQLPLAPNIRVSALGIEILWQAYDEWLFVTPDGTQGALASTLRDSLAGHPSAVTDVSDLRAALEVRGPHARDVLQKGCAVDLHSRVFGADACVQTALARVRVTLRRMNESTTYQLLVERSYARYLWDWLADASLEYRA